MSLKAVTNVPEKQQEQIPLVEYAELDYNKNKSPQHHNLTSGYDEINENSTNKDTGVSIVIIQ